MLICIGESLGHLFYQETYNVCICVGMCTWILITGVSYCVYHFFFIFYFFGLFVFFFVGRVFPRSSSYLELYVDLAGLQLTEINLLC